MEFSNYFMFKVLFISNHCFTRKLIISEQIHSNREKKTMWFAEERRLSLKIVAIKIIPNNLIRVRSCLNFKNFALTPTHWPVTASDTDEIKSEINICLIRI